VQVHYGEGVAIHIGPEPCVGTREGDGEADRISASSTRRSPRMKALRLVSRERSP